MALGSDALHSGMHGSPGDSRFHLILKSHNGVQVADATADATEEADSVHCCPVPIVSRSSWSRSFAAQRKLCANVTPTTTFDSHRRAQESTGKKVIDSLFLTCMDIKGAKKSPKTAAVKTSI
jgi:hypothetical protein